MSERIEITPFDPWQGLRTLLGAKERLQIPIAHRPPAHWYTLLPRQRELLGGLARAVVVRHLAEGWPGPRARIHEALRATHDPEERVGGYGHDLTVYHDPDPERREEWRQLQATLESSLLRDGTLLNELVNVLVARQLAIPETQDDTTSQQTPPTAA